MGRDVDGQRPDLFIGMQLAKDGELIRNGLELGFQLLDITAMIARERPNKPCLADFGGEFHATAHEHRGRHRRQRQPVTNVLGQCHVGTSGRQRPLVRRESDSLAGVTRRYTQNSSPFPGQYTK